ncbi:MAG: zf-HC2 domain-containing protein [Nitrospira sp.]|nr:zf-HC2 domain-containing protein [Nitrospira sp.]
MKCKKAQSLIHELVVGSIGEEEGEKLVLHLKGCPRCERECAALMNLTSFLKSLPLPDPGEEFWRTLPFRVEKEIEKITRERVGAYGLMPFRIWDWIFQPGRSAYAFVSMAIIMIVTVLFFYPRYAVREVDTEFRGRQEISTPLVLLGEDSIVDEEGEKFADVEDLNLYELNLLYASLVSSVRQKRAEQELFEERIGGVVTADIGSELNDLNHEELQVLSRKLTVMYPEFQEKGVL